ncbi:MAG: hypothetical protein V8R17_03365 [Blautia obeum]
MLVKYIIKVFLYLILAVMTLIHWLLKIPMILGNILLYFLSIIFILTGVLSYGFALESARECGRMIIISSAGSDSTSDCLRSGYTDPSGKNAG